MKDLFPCFPRLLTYKAGSETPDATGKLTPEYRTVDREPTEEDFARHLRGEQSLGVSPLLPDNTAQWGAIDIDDYGICHSEKDLKAVMDALHGSTGALFRTKSSALHFYMFANAPVPAADMVDALELVRAKLPPKYRKKAKEIFPKQTDAKSVKTPSQINLPLFGAQRGLVRLFTVTQDGEVEKANAGVPGDAIPHKAVINFIRKHCLHDPSEIKQMAESNRERKRGGRPVRDMSSEPTGYREPDVGECPGRNEFLYKCASSMRARGATTDDAIAQLKEINRHYAEIGHPLWDSKGALPESEIEAMRKQIDKYKQGVPTGLKYDIVEALNQKYAIMNAQGHLEIVNLGAERLETFAKSHFFDYMKPHREFIGGKPHEIAPLWFADIDARRYDGYCIEPTDYVGDRWNLFRGFTVEPREGDASPFFKTYLLETLCGGDKETARWVTHYLADLVQRPTEPSPPTAIVIVGGQGVGKTFLTEFMRHILGDHSFARVVSAEELFTRFNRSMAAKPLISAEETFFTGNKSAAQMSKALISQSTWLYEQKYAASLTLKNVHRVIATTNELHAVNVENDDRRWTVIEIRRMFDTNTPEGKAASNAFWKPLYEFMTGDGPAFVLNELLKVQVDRAFLMHGLTNAAKSKQKILSDPILAWLDDVATTGCLPHDFDGKGVVSLESMYEAVKEMGGATARHLTKQKVSEGAIAHTQAAKCRTAVYVESSRVVQLESGPKIDHRTKQRQRGLDFGNLYVFRQEVAKHTGARYDDDMNATWQHWDEEVRDGPSDEAKVESFDRFLAEQGVSDEQRRKRGDGVMFDPRV